MYTLKFLGSTHKISWLLSLRVTNGRRIKCIRNSESQCRADFLVNAAPLRYSSTTLLYSRFFPRCSDFTKTIIGGAWPTRRGVDICACLSDFRMHLMRRPFVPLRLSTRQLIWHSVRLVFIRLESPWEVKIFKFNIFSKKSRARAYGVPPPPSSLSHARTHTHTYKHYHTDGNINIDNDTIIYCVSIYNQSHLFLYLVSYQEDIANGNSLGNSSPVHII